MDTKQFLTLTRLLKFDDESSKALGTLLKSRFPKRYVQFIIKAKPYWVSMRVLITSSSSKIQTFRSCDEIKIKFLLQEDRTDKLDRILWPIYLTIGKARCKQRVTVEHKFWIDNTLSQREEDYIQHDYWWRF